MCVCGNWTAGRCRGRGVRGRDRAGERRSRSARAGSEQGEGERRQREGAQIDHLSRSVRGIGSVKRSLAFTARGQLIRGRRSWQACLLVLGSGPNRIVRVCGCVPRAVYASHLVRSSAWACYGGIWELRAVFSLFFEHRCSVVRPMHRYGKNRRICYNMFSRQGQPLVLKSISCSCELNRDTSSGICPKA